jgi:hypothetical protein
VCPLRGIVLQSCGLVDHSLGNSARALVFDIRSCCCRQRSLRDRRHWAAGLRVDVGLQNEGRRFGTCRLGNLTDWRTGGESRYLLRRRRDAHSRSRRCGWSAPLLRQNEPQGRNAEDRQHSNDNDDQAHLITLSARAAAGVDHVQKKFRDDDGPPIASVHIRTRGMSQQIWQLGDVGGDAPASLRVSSSAPHDVPVRPRNRRRRAPARCGPDDEARLGLLDRSGPRLPLKAPHQ